MALALRGRSPLEEIAWCDRILAGHAAKLHHPDPQVRQLARLMLDKWLDTRLLWMHRHRLESGG